MIRFILYAACYLAGLLFSFAQVKEETILIKNGAIELPGTLSYTEEKSTLIIWVHGSGNVDRNGNQQGVINANYIQQVREKINNENIAFFSFDKRTSNPTNLEHLKELSFIDLVNDVKTVIGHFKEHFRFSSITLIGHSQGSLIAMLASEKADSFISLAGAGAPIDEVITKQISTNSPMLVPFVEKHFKELKDTGKIEEVNPFLTSLFAPQNQPFILSWMQYHPSKEIEKLTIPILIINGDKDLQVSIKDAELLHTAQPKATLTIINNMNHVLKQIEKDEDNIKSYYSPDFPISNQLITSIVSFITHK